MHDFYVIGNLKMNMLSREDVAQYLAVLNRESQGKKYRGVKGVICPPFPYLAAFDALPAGFFKGAQNVSHEKSGAYTGEVSPVMLRNENVAYVIVGHSERRRYHGESDELIREKTVAVLKHHMTPVLCIGEMREERDAQNTDRVLSRQVKAVFSGLSKLQAEKIIIAYEPRWAIGTDVLPTTQEIMQVRIFLRKLLTELFDAATAERISVLYGGSVKSSFLSSVSWEAAMDGVLVGRESLFPFEIVKMMNLLEERAIEEQGE